LLGQHGFTGARLAFHQKRTLQGDGRINGKFEIVCGDVGLGAFELHRSFLGSGLARRHFMLI